VPKLKVTPQERNIVDSRLSPTISTVLTHDARHARVRIAVVPRPARVRRSAERDGRTRNRASAPAFIRRASAGKGKQGYSRVAARIEFAVGQSLAASRVEPRPICRCPPSP